MRLEGDFYAQDVLDAAPALLGKVICRAGASGVIRRGRITEVEVYRGEADTACHARVGRTRRTSVLYRPGGYAYVYLCYGIHHLFNIVTGPVDQPQAALIRGIEGAVGPGRTTAALGITTADNDTDLRTAADLWLEDDGTRPVRIAASPRVGIGYASPEDQARLWRFTSTA